MKQKFSTKWKSSRQPRKKRKFIANAPLHIKRNFLSATLSKELRKKYNRRSLEIRKGDEVKIMRGKFKKKTGKITVIDTKKSRAGIENIQITKKDGTKINVWISASNLQIISLNLDDKKRLKRNHEEKGEVKSQETEKTSKTKNKSKGEKNAPEKK